MRWFGLVMCVGALGCLDKTPPPVAPSAIDQNLKWFWNNGQSVDDATLIDGAAKLAVAGKADTRTTPLKGQMPSRLEKSDLTVVNLELNEPASARGLLVVNLFDCTLDKLEKILSAADQKAQYDGVYDAYSRTFSTDAAAFADKRTNVLNWDIDLKASLPVNDTYSSHLKGGLRRVPAAASSATKGPFLIARTWLTAPAEFGKDSTSYFKQDYQIEVFWEQSPGRIFHAYGMWREIKDGGFNLTLEDDGFMNIVLDNLVKWDDTTVSLCKKM